VRPAPRSEPPGESIADLRVQVAALQARQETLGAELSALEPDVANQPPTDPKTDAADEEPRPELAAIVEEQQVALEQLLTQEQGDPEWAAWAEAEIATRAGTVLSGATGVRTECGAAVCRTEVAFDDPDLARQALDRLTGLVTWSSDCFSLIDDSDPTTAILYATREGVAMPSFGATGM
jgi:hypothetical protein